MLWLLMLEPLPRSNFLHYHFTLENRNRLQMTVLSGGLRGLKKVAGGDTEHQLYQLKVHLDQTASDVFRMIRHF